MMMMVPSKAKSGSTRAQGDLKASRLSRNGSTKSDAPKPRGLVDRPTKSFESKVSSKNSTTSTPSKPSLQQGRSEAVEVELKKETVARMRAEEILAAERRRIKELEEELQIKHERDVSSLSCMAEELRRAKEELRAAEAEKEMILREVDDAKRAAKVHEEKAALATKEACDRKALHESLQSELERARIAEEKLVHMESLIEKLQIEATDARIGESDASALADEWRSKAERLKADLEEAHQSEKSASDSLADMMVKLEESKSLFQDAETEISILRARISSSEIESARQKIDLEESNRQLESARQDALNIGETVELLKLELRRLEEEEKSKSLTEENERLAGELKLSRDEAEKASEAMECLALEVKAMSIGAREKEERLTRMQTEIEESNKEIERLSRVLRNTEERYEVMLDEARYELVCLKNRCEEEQSFVCTIRRLEEEIASLKAEMATRVELQEIDEHEKNESIDDMEPANSNSIPDDDEEEEEEEEPSENEVSNAEVLEYTENGYREGHGEEETETVDDDLDSKMNADGGIDHANGTERRRLPRKKKKKTLLYNFGNLLKKGNH